MSRPFRRALAGAVALAAAFTLAGCSLVPPPARDDESGEVVRGGQESAVSLKVGDCWEDVGDEGITHVPVVPCDDGYDNQVYALFDLPAGAYPGEEGVQYQGENGCYDRFPDAIGVAYEESELEFFILWPSEEGWERGDDREIVCSIWSPAGKLTGSMLGSGR